MVKEDTILILVGGAAGVYLLNKGGFFNKASSGLGNVFEGVGDAVGGLGSGVGQIGQAAGDFGEQVLGNVGGVTDLLDPFAAFGAGAGQAVGQEFEQAEFRDIINEPLRIEGSYQRAAMTERFKTSFIKAVTNPFGSIRDAQAAGVLPKPNFPNFDDFGNFISGSQKKLRNLFTKAALSGNDILLPSKAFNIAPSTIALKEGEEKATSRPFFGRSGKKLRRIIKPKVIKTSTSKISYGRKTRRGRSYGSTRARREARAAGNRRKIRRKVKSFYSRARSRIRGFFRKLRR